MAFVAFNLSTRALELAEDGLATKGGLAYAARMISLVFLWVLVAVVAIFLLFVAVALGRS